MRPQAGKSRWKSIDIIELKRREIYEINFSFLEIFFVLLFPHEENLLPVPTSYNR